MEIRIRAAEAADLPVLVRLLRELFTIEADFAADEARQRIGLTLLMSDRRPLQGPAPRGDGGPGTGAEVLVADRGGEVIGMVTGQLVVSTAEGGLSALVEDMVVDAPERGKGVGRALLAAIERWAESRGASRLQLLADRENAPALAFYEREGWRSTRLVCLRRCGR